ncbi:MAG: polysaccharide export protein [Opitutales bacterium]|nr:polysaccharide export protein [Opitutales bacterium]
MKNFKKLTLFVAVAFLGLAACERTDNSALSTTRNQDLAQLNQSRDYRIRPMDLIHFEIFQEPDQRNDYRVTGDGNITLPYLNQVFVKGLTLLEAKGKIEKLYRDGGYYKDPQVSLQINQYAERRVYIDGFVAATGPLVMPMEEELTLGRAITMARGLQPRASRTNVLLTRNIDGEDKTFVINVAEIQEGRAPDIHLEEGDRIYVQDSKI